KPASVRSPQHRARRIPDSQQTLEFREAVSESVVHPGETIYCDAPVALPVHRLLAATVDGALVLTGVGVFLVFFFLLGGDISLDRHALPFLAGITAMVGLFYRAIWCLADGDSPGMRFAGLKLIDFDGRRPDREVRLVRQVASLLGFLSVGLGLVWA